MRFNGRIVGLDHNGRAGTYAGRGGPFNTGQVGGSFRQTLTSLLLRDAATVANYQPGVGITGALNVSAWANQIGIAPALAQATATNQPISLPFSGTKYAYLSGVAANYLSTPDVPANRITGNIDLRVQIAADDWTPAAQSYFIAKYTTAGMRVFRFGLNVDGTFLLITSLDGTALNSNDVSTVSNTIADGTTAWARVTRNATTGAVNFYTSTDGINWTPLGAQVAGTPGNMFEESTNPLELGSIISGANSLIQGKIYRAQIYNGINGTLAVDFNAADWSETSINAATQVSSTTGETWTLNNTGALLAQIVGSPSLLFDGVDNFMATGAFTLNQPTTVYFVGKQVTWTNNDFFWDGVTDNVMNVQQSGVTPRIGMYAGNSLAESVGKLAVNTYGVLTTLYNGASSSLQVDSNAAITGDAGASNGGGFTLGRPGTTAAQYGNIQVKEIIIRNVADSTATQAQIQSLLKAIHGTP